MYFQMVVLECPGPWDVDTPQSRRRLAWSHSETSPSLKEHGQCFDGENEAQSSASFGSRPYPRLFHTIIPHCSNPGLRSGPSLEQSFGDQGSEKY